MNVGDEGGGGGVDDEHGDGPRKGDADDLVGGLVGLDVGGGDDEEEEGGEEDGGELEDGEESDANGAGVVD